MTFKQRAYLKSLAMTMDPILEIGKSSVTPELTAAVAEALEARELIKLHVLQNCGDDLRWNGRDPLQSVHVPRWYRLSEEKSFFIKREKTTRRKSFFLNEWSIDYENRYYGGTFDPIHNGHLMLGEYAYQQFHLDEVWYMPKRQSVPINQIRKYEKIYRTVPK